MSGKQIKLELLWLLVNITSFINNSIKLCFLQSKKEKRKNE